MDILSNFFRIFCGFSGPEYDDVRFYGQKSTFPKCDILYINQKIILYWSFFTKRLSCLLLFLFWVWDGRGEVVGWKMMKYDDVITYSSSKMKVCKIWHIMYQSKDNSVMIIFWSLKDLGTSLVLELGGLKWKMIKQLVTFYLQGGRNTKIIWQEQH